MIEIIDRNLYERSCDIRWWATDSAVVNCVLPCDFDDVAFATRRLGVILDSYTVYLDIWILDCDGKVLSNGRPSKYPGVVGRNYAAAPWFKQAMATRDATDYAVADIFLEPVLGSSVATYSTAIRNEDQPSGPPLGVLAIWFDWQSQAQAVVKGLHLSEEEKRRSRCLIVDSAHRVIAASDEKGILRETFPLKPSQSNFGSYVDEFGAIVGFALTPGYETYKGLGWYGVVVQTDLEPAP